MFEFLAQSYGLLAGAGFVLAAVAAAVVYVARKNKKA